MASCMDQYLRMEMPFADVFTPPGDTMPDPSFLFRFYSRSWLPSSNFWKLSKLAMRFFLSGEIFTFYWYCC